MSTDEDLPDLERFGHDEAWRVGSALVERCRAEGMPVVIGITIGEQRVFHAALTGSSADNDHWAARKARVVRRFDRSSQQVGARYRVEEQPGFHEAFGLAPADYAPTGGAVPIRVRGTQVGVLVISGLTSAEDHDLAVSALEALVAEGGR